MLSASLLTLHDKLFAHVAQGIERRFPKPQVAGSIPAVGTNSITIVNKIISIVHSYNKNDCLWIILNKN